MQVQGTDSARFSVGAEKSLKALKKTNRQLQKVMERLSTGKRINNAADDAAGLATAEQLSTQIRGFKMASKNVSDAVSTLNITDGAAKETSAMIQRQRELAVAARNDTLTDQQRGDLDKEYQALSKEVDRISNATQFNNQTTANGAQLASGAAQIQSGPNSGDTISLPQINLGATNLGTTGTSIATAASAQNAIGSLDNALSTLNSQRSLVGATVNQLTSTDNNLQVAMINTQAAESVLRDQDVAQGLADLTRSRLLQEGATKAFARFNETSQNHIVGLLQ